MLLPKPIFDAKVPVTDTESLTLLPLTTSLPALLSEAVTCAVPGRSALMALIRLATVSLAFELYVVA